MKNNLINPIEIYQISTGFLVFIPTIDSIIPGMDSRGFKKLMDDVMRGAGQDEIEKLIYESNLKTESEKIDFTNKNVSFCKDWESVLSYLQKLGV